LQPALEGFKAMLLSGANDPNAPDSQLVAEAIVRLVDAAPGTRPLRTVVDVQFPHARDVK
jgi:hypothetical protein